MTHAAWNRLMHALHGNGSSINEKLQQILERGEMGDLPCDVETRRMVGFATLSEWNLELINKDFWRLRNTILDRINRDQPRPRQDRPNPLASQWPIGFAQCGGAWSEDSALCMVCKDRIQQSSRGVAGVVQRERDAVCHRHQLKHRLALEDYDLTLEMEDELKIGCYVRAVVGQPTRDPHSSPEFVECHVCDDTIFLRNSWLPGTNDRAVVDHHISMRHRRCMEMAELIFDVLNQALADGLQLSATESPPKGVGQSD